MTTSARAAVDAMLLRQGGYTDMDQPYIPIARPLIGEVEKAAVLAVLDSGQLAQGARVRELETRFAEYIGVRHAIATVLDNRSLAEMRESANDDIAVELQHQA